MKGILAAFLALVALSTVLAAAPGSAEERPESRRAPDRELRVASFNIHHGAGTDGVVDLDRVARVVDGAGVDVIGLQEVDRHWSERSDFVDQANWLADRLGMHVVYGANLDRDPLAPGDPRRQYGTAILSRHPILESTNTLLPRPEGGEQRGLLEARIVVRGVPVRVFNTHLQHNSQGERLAQIARIRDLVAGSSDSVVLLGDLNATPDSDEIGQITEDLVDAWEAAGEGDGYTLPATDPTVRIDYVLSSSDVVARTAAVISTEASDHLPVTADLALPGARVGVGHR